MITIINDISLIFPEITILVTAIITLFTDLFNHKNDKSLIYCITLLGLTIAAGSCLLLFGGSKLILFSGLLISDDSAQLMKIFIILSVFLSLFYSRDYLNQRDIPIGDYCVLSLFSTLGMLILVSAYSLLTIYLGVELLSLPLYAMITIQKNCNNANEAALKYFIMGSIASGLLLYGLSFVYGITGQLELLPIANTITSHWHNNHLLLTFAIVFIVTGIGFKLAAAPFHMWTPDVYEGSPTAVTIFLSAAPKIAAIGMALRVLTFALAEIAIDWQQLLIIMSVLSIGIGNLLAIVQNNIKRLLSYSAISHIGYILFGLIAINNDGYSSSLYYILIYALMAIAAFGLIIILSQHNTELTDVRQLSGLNKRHPWLAFMMLIVMFSMAGVPPTVGFFAKLLVLTALINTHIIWLAVFGLIFAVVGAYYYLRIVKIMYFDEITTDTINQVILTPSLIGIYSLNCLSLLYLGLFPFHLISICNQMFN